MSSLFKKAKRTQAKLKLALTGPSGSGKTFSALRLATGIGGKIAVIDTENGSASLYSDRFEFDVAEISPPYTVDKFVSAIKSASEAGYDVLIIDSISHQWRGEGGLLNKKEQLDARGGNSFTNWAKLTPEQERFMAALLHAPIHTICTLRSKQEYAMVDGGNGKQKIQKLGLAPIQRDGMEYEFTTVLDVAMSHEAEASKDRTGLFVDRIFKISEETGKELKTWLESGDAPSEKPGPLPPPPAPQVENQPPLDEGFSGDYICLLPKFKNKTVREIVAEIGKPALQKYIADCEEFLKKERKPPSSNLKFLKVNADRYFAWLAEQPPTAYDIPLTEEEEMQVEAMINEQRMRDKGRI